VQHSLEAKKNFTEATRSICNLPLELPEDRKTVSENKVKIT